MFLLFNTLPRFVIAFLWRSNHLDIMATVTIRSDLRVLEEEVCHFFHIFPFYLSCSNGGKCMVLVFLIFSLNLALSLSSFTLIKRLLVPLSFLPLEWYHLHIWGCWCFSHLSWFQLVTHPVWHFSLYVQYIG